MKTQREEGPNVERKLVQFLLKQRGAHSFQFHFQFHFQLIEMCFSEILHQQFCGPACWVKFIRRPEFICRTMFQ